MRQQLARTLLLAFLFISTAAHSADWIADADERITHTLRQRLELYFRALNAPPEEQKQLEAQDPAQGIWLMQRNAFLRARLRLVEILTPSQREDLLKGRPYVSKPYAKLPKQVQSWMDEALGVGRLDPALRDATRYQLRRSHQDGAHHLMISQVDPRTGKPTSGGSVVPGIPDPKPPAKAPPPRSDP